MGLRQPEPLENKVNGARLPIVALTANSFHESRKEIAAVGMNDFLSKPIEPTELSRVLSEYLNKKATLMGGFCFFR